MVVEILAANAIAISIRIISPAEDAPVRDLARKEIAEPVDAFRGRPSLVPMSVQSMNNDNTTKVQDSHCSAWGSAYSTAAQSPSTTTLRP